MEDKQQLPLFPDEERPYEDYEIVEDADLPLERQEKEVALIETQNINSKPETGLVLAKEAQLTARFDVKALWQSFVHALQWSQLKRHFTKVALIDHAKRHGYKVVLLGAVLYAVPIHVNQDATTTPADLLTYTGANRGVPSEQAVTLPPTAPAIAVLPVSAQQSFVDRFVSVAQGEMKKFGIPASVILALAIVQSEYGSTTLAQSGHNYFRLSCNQNPLAEGIADRVMYDGACYVHYENAWTSFRANSVYLQTAPYQRLQGTEDLRQWAVVLEEEGIVAAALLLATIDKHELHDYDQLNEK